MVILYSELLDKGHILSIDGSSCLTVHDRLGQMRSLFVQGKDSTPYNVAAETLEELFMMTKVWAIHHLVSQQVCVPVDAWSPLLVLMRFHRITGNKVMKGSASCCCSDMQVATTHCSAKWSMCLMQRFAHFSCASFIGASPLWSNLLALRADTSKFRAHSVQHRLGDNSMSGSSQPSCTRAGTVHHRDRDNWNLGAKFIGCVKQNNF